MLSFAIRIYFSPVPHLFLAVVSVSMSNFLINNPDKLLLCRQVTKKGKKKKHTPLQCIFTFNVLEICFFFFIWLVPYHIKAREPLVDNHSCKHFTSFYLFWSRFVMLITRVVGLEALWYPVCFRLLLF